MRPASSPTSRPRASTPRKTVSSSLGRHAVLLVGFLNNDQLAQVGQPSDVPGGATIVRTWAALGDSGWPYLPVAYAQQVFDVITQPRSTTRAAAPGRPSRPRRAVAHRPR
jgi:hypothetical protein